MLFHTPGYGHDTTPIALRSDEIIISHLGETDIDLPDGSSIVARWQMAEHANIGWGEVAILAGAPPGNGAMVTRWVGAVDQSAEWRAYAPGVHANAVGVLSAPVLAGESLYVAFAQWCPDIVTGSGTHIPSTVVVKLTGSDWTDPLAAGYCGVLLGGWKPSTSIGQTVSFDVFQATKPVACVVTFALPV